MRIVRRPIERYRRIKLLGHGGMATVELAHDTELDRPVALKLLAENLAADDEFKHRFLREARLAARLSHPNIVGVYDVGEDEGRPYIVMEYVEGETLSDVLQRRGKLEPEEAAELGRQACAGLETAHRAGLVHRDIKPQNLLVTPSGTLKIADFGIARSVDGTRLTEAGTVLGTAAYVAPEQAAGEDVGLAADVYSLGAVVYELLTGRPPYEAQSLVDLVTRQREASITPVRELAPDVPASLEDAVMHALARTPGYRPSSAAAFSGELGGAATAMTKVDRSQAPPRRLLRGRRRRAALPVVIALAALVLVVGLALAFHHGSKRMPAPSPPPSLTGTRVHQAHAFATWLRAHATAK